MKIVDPQTATLTNIEVLSYFTANPPRKSPEGPQGVINFVPKPDLRNHCTVVTEIHNYVERTSPHLLNYPRYTHGSQAPTTHTLQQPSTDQQQPYIQPKEPIPLDNAIRKLVRELAPYNFTKGEVVMLINLGVGVKSKKLSNNSINNAMDVDGDEVRADQEEEDDDENYPHRALMHSVIEELDMRLSEEDVDNVLRIMNETLGSEN